MPAGWAPAGKTRSSRMRDRTGQKGLTLIELLVTVSILGVSFVVIVGGLGTAILGSDYHHRQVNADATVRTVADEVRSLEYEDCATGPFYQTELEDSGYIAPTGYDVLVSEVGYLTGDDFETTCPGGGDEGLQLVKITVTAQERSVQESIEVVKRDE